MAIANAWYRGPAHSRVSGSALKGRFLRLVTWLNTETAALGALGAPTDVFLAGFD
jgi:hypothetical protein